MKVKIKGNKKQAVNEEVLMADEFDRLVRPAVKKILQKDYYKKAQKANRFYASDIKQMKNDIENGLALSARIAGVNIDIGAEQKRINMTVNRLVKYQYSTIEESEDDILLAREKKLKDELLKTKADKLEKRARELRSKMN